MNITAPAQRHDRLALRLSVIICRFLMGDSLSMRALLEKFGVSECAQRRDVRPRLLCLDITSSRLF